MRVGGFLGCLAEAAVCDVCLEMLRGEGGSVMQGD